MTAHIIFYSFFALLTLKYFSQMVLVFLNTNSILRHKKSIPQDFKDFVTLEEYNISVKYSLEKEKFSLLRLTVDFIFLFVIIISGFPAFIYSGIEAFNLPWYLPEFIFLTVLSIPFSILSSLFDLYSTFVIEEKFGFNKMTLKLVISDSIKSLLVTLVISVPILWGLFALLEKGPDWWWLIGAGGYTLFQLVVSALYPIVIAPLFNKFTPLEEGELKEKLYALAEKCRFKTKGIYVMDESKRSTHSNAYFTGIGPSKRIVLYNTLIEKLSVDELTAVLAHEIGHYKHKHILKRTIASIALSFGFFFLLSLLIKQIPFFNAFGFDKPGSDIILFLLTITLPLLMFFFTPLINAFSRKDEYQADRYAAENSQGKEDLARALLTLNKENHSNLTPDKLYSAFYYSHPTLKERIDRIKNTPSKQ